MEDVVLVINPGSTSTKIAIYNRTGPLYDANIQHPSDELQKFDKVTEQYELRLDAIEKAFNDHGMGDYKVVGIAGRGAPTKPLVGGTYEVNKTMLKDLRSCKYANHASNLGAIIADKLAKNYKVKAYITDPITTDEFIPEARISGVPQIERKCRSHALNIKANARDTAAKIGKPLDELNFVVCHMGGGISVCALRGGKIIDVNDALLGMGPFSPDRAGALPIGGVVKMCYSGEFSQKEIEDIYSRKSGLLAYLGTSDLREVEQMISDKDEIAILIFNAMAFQIAKEIGAMTAVLKGKVDGIILTGGMANSRLLLDRIEDYLGQHAEIYEQPGELEMPALAAGAWRVIEGKEEALEYK
ncbi:MAG: butyrate kinase [candidate division Zixibacteria bacterium]|nr:butyrate kinase [candidate division Zixibacteria bacterium]NIR62262.1 butyrate kinase [candidate division Zixibacteria bacterium]NIS14840.1 butyrate kinase [candidate division Zixibacteria bacterium]NIS44498.1 butyrate kinase [candidate division Zixibacteria bacterium]NIU12512.1 butyrate kinase [candidate division Zixibacteria bacterium]